MKYGEAIRQALTDSLDKIENLHIIGQGVWSPFYVGSTMKDLAIKFGKERIIDTPVSENGVTALALGAALTGTPMVVVHPRMDFMILAMDAIVNAAAKWRYVLDARYPIPLTIRAIINRGGEQGAQHSQALHSWFAHVPGLRVVMPSSAKDAYYLLRQSIESPDPVIFIEDRWSYDQNEQFKISNNFTSLSNEGSKLLKSGKDITVVGIGHTTNQILNVYDKLIEKGINIDVVDVRVLQPFDPGVIIKSVNKTGKLLVVDGAWRNSGFASEVISSVCEKISIPLSQPPVRLTLPDAPAPTSNFLERYYYITEDKILKTIVNLLKLHKITLSQEN